MKQNLLKNPKLKKLLNKMVDKGIIPKSCLSSIDALREFVLSNPIVFNQLINQFVSVLEDRQEKDVTKVRRIMDRLDDF